MDTNKATSEDLNLYAWNTLLLPGPPAPDAIEAAERANGQSKNTDFGILHTLACIYAEIGKESQARELLIQAMDAAYLEKPNSAIWFGFAKLAEQYGEIQTAQTLYQRVEKPKQDTPGSNYALAQARLLALKNSSSSSTSAAK